RAKTPALGKERCASTASTQRCLVLAAVLERLELFTVGRVVDVVDLVLLPHLAPRRHRVVDERLFAVDGGDDGEFVVPRAVGTDAPVDLAVVGAAVEEDHVLVAALEGGGVIAHTPLVPRSRDKSEPPEPPVGGPRLDSQLWQTPPIDSCGSTAR